MPRLPFCVRIPLAICCVLAFASPAAAVRPSEKLLPTTTKGYLSVPDVDELRARWNETQLGHLVNDPAMKPFAEDLQRQLREKLTRTGVRLGVTWEDLDGVYGGEVCTAAIQPGKEDSHATVMLVDVTGKIDEANELLAKIDKNQLEKGAKKSIDKIGTTELIVYELPKKKDEKTARHAYYFIAHQQLVAADHREVIEGIHKRLTGEHTDALEDVPAFAGVVKRCSEASGEHQPHIRWFIEPFGYTQVLRAGNGGRRKRGMDMLKVLAKEGFDAIQGLGGFVHFSTGEHEIRHHTLIYAPPVKRGPEDSRKQRYNRAAQMLDFPNRSPLTAQDWVPRDLATYLSFNWKMEDAFYHSKTLVDAVADAEVFDDVLDSLRDDPNGPRVDIRKGLVAHLGERATILSDCVVPVTPKSERMLVAIEVTNPQIVAETIEKAMKSDPDARKLVVEGHVVWEILDQEKEVPTLQIDGPGGLAPIGTGDDDDDDDDGADEDKKPLLRNSAMTVVGGHLIVATHVDFLVRVLRKAPNEQSLAGSVDYQAVNAELERLGASDDAFRFFARTDEAYRATYELIRQGKMPEAETLLGKLLNRMMGPEEDDELREQQIDGRKLPEYQVARRYFGPAGMFVKSQEDGWLLTGVLLNKETLNGNE